MRSTKPKAGQEEELQASEEAEEEEEGSKGGSGSEGQNEGTG